MMPVDELWDVREALTQACILQGGLTFFWKMAGTLKEQLLLMAVGSSIGRDDQARVERVSPLIFSLLSIQPRKTCLRHQ